MQPIDFSLKDGKFDIFRHFYNVDITLHSTLSLSNIPKQKEIQIDVRDLFVHKQLAILLDWVEVDVVIFKKYQLLQIKEEVDGEE